MSDPFRLPVNLFKYRFSCWIGIAFTYLAVPKVRRLGYHCFVGPEAYADYIYAETDDGETREAALKKLNEALHKNGAGPSNYVHLTFA